MVYKRCDRWHMDVMISGVRYREALHTSDRREALRLEKKRVGEIQAGKGASKSGRELARLAFGAAADRFCDDWRLQVSERTAQLDRERLQPLRVFFGDTPMLRIKASEIAAYQRARLNGEVRLKSRADAVERRGVANRTVNMEITVLRQMMRRGRVWSVVAEDVQMLPERHSVVGRVVTAEEKKLLFRVAAGRPAWMVAYCAAVLAVSTTCRGVELKHLRWQDVDLLDRCLIVRRSKTAAGQRTIPLNADAVGALTRLRSRADLNGTSEADHFVFPA